MWRSPNSLEWRNIARVDLWIRSVIRGMRIGLLVVFWWACRWSWFLGIIDCLLLIFHFGILLGSNAWLEDNNTKTSFTLNYVGFIELGIFFFGLWVVRRWKKKIAEEKKRKQMKLRGEEMKLCEEEKIEERSGRTKKKEDSRRRRRDQRKWRENGYCVIFNKSRTRA